MNEQTFNDINLYEPLIRSIDILYLIKIRQVILRKMNHRYTDELTAIFVLNVEIKISLLKQIVFIR